MKIALRCGGRPDSRAELARRRLIFVRGLCLVALLLPLAFASRAFAQSSPVGDEFQINTVDEVESPSVASDLQGAFVVVYLSFNGGDVRIFGQRFAASGEPSGAEFQIDSSPPNDRRSPAVAVDDDGDFVVVWQSGDGQDGDERGIFARRFDASGAALGGELQVNNYSTGNQRQPAVAMTGSGDFVVAWQSRDQDGSGYGVVARLFDDEGVPITDDLLVNTYTPGDQLIPEVSADAEGNFVVVWTAEGSGGDGYDVWGRLFDAAGAPLSGEFVVNSDMPDHQIRADVVRDASGSFAVVWANEVFGGFPDLKGRWFDDSGNPLTDDFQVTTHTADWPRIDMGLDGDLVVVWQSYGMDGHNWGVFGRQFDSSGAPTGEEFQINTFTTGAQRDPVLTTQSTGEFVVVWESHLGGFDGDIFGQLFGQVLFEDGFESGDTSAWSVTVP